MDLTLTVTATTLRAFFFKVRSEVLYLAADSQHLSARVTFKFVGTSESFSPHNEINI